MKLLTLMTSQFSDSCKDNTDANVYSSVHLSVIHNFYISSQFTAVVVLAGNPSSSPGKENIAELEQQK